MAGRFIISLDFELMWGVCDHRSVGDYGDAILGGRRAIPLMLDLFRKHQVRATWATVGLLFARNRDEMRSFAPTVQPNYGAANLSPYPDLTDVVGKDEQDDPYHFGRSLLDQIAQAEGQEIASHTYGHVYALEPGMSAAAWSADIQAACAIADHAGHTLRSIVFPRNQMGPEQIRICQDQGMTAWRGVPKGRIYRTRSGAEQSLPVRALRLLDGAVPVLGDQSFDMPAPQEGGINIPASRFLRPWSSRMPIYSRLHQARILREMETAATQGKHYHLWWHPHNMGRNTAQNMAQLEVILGAFVRLRDQYGFESNTMADIAEQEGAV